MSVESANPSGPAAPPRRPWTEVVRAAPVTTIIFAVCAVVFLVAESVGSTRSNATLAAFGAVGRRWVWSGEYWRLFTSMFVHIGVIHLVANAWFGFGICAQAEKQLGRWRFLGLYLGSGVVGAAASVIGHDALSAGASGALFGVIGWLLVTLRLRFGSLRAFTQHPLIRQQLTWIVAWFILGAFVGFDNYAHGGGLLFGGLYGWALADGAPPRARRVRIAIALGIGALLVVASLHPLPFVHRWPPPDLHGGGGD